MKIKNIKTGIIWECNLPEDLKIAKENINKSNFELVEISEEEKEFIEIPKIPKSLSIEDRLLYKEENKNITKNIDEMDRKELKQELVNKNIPFNNMSKTSHLLKLLKGNINESQRNT